MTQELWPGVLLAVTIVLATLAVASAGLRAAGLRRLQQRRFTCPVFGTAVECGIVQDIRTGQWKSVQRCSAFHHPGDVVCRQECARLMNLGLPLPQTPAR